MDAALARLVRCAPMPLAMKCLRWIYTKIARSCLRALEEIKYNERVRKCWQSVRMSSYVSAVYEERALEQALQITGRSNTNWADHLAITIESLRFLMECDVARRGEENNGVRGAGC